MAAVLRANQRKLQDDVIDAWTRGARCAMPVMATGGGKTVTMAKTAAERCKGRGIVQAHRSELVGQLSLAWAREGIEHDLTVSAAVRRQIIDNHLDKLGRSYYRPDADWSVESVDTAMRREPKRGIDYVFQDEGHHCFPAGTLIDGRPIATLQIGDVVTAFDESTGRALQSHVTHVFKHISPQNMVRVAAGHHVVESTFSHPFWTQRGWVNAGDLTDADYVYLLQDEISPHQIQHAAQMGDDGNCILREQSVRLCVQGCKSKTPLYSGNSNLHALSESMRCAGLGTDAMEKKQDCLLQQGLFCSREKCEVFENNEHHKQHSCISANDCQKPNAQCCNTGKSLTKFEGQKTADSGWSGCAGDTGRANLAADACACRVCESVHFQNGNTAPESLQNRLCSPIAKNCNRSRWQITSDIETQSIRPAQGRMLTPCRVDSVTVFKSTDCETAFDGYVYNIEVAKHHTYFANGIAVHNCLRANKWGKALEHYPNAKWLLPTATPGRSDGMGLGAHADGHVNALLMGPNLATLMTEGFLVTYDILTPTASDLDLTGVGITASGEFNQAEVARRVKQSSRIVGDAVGHYLKHASGRLCIVFAVDIDHAETLLAAYLARGVPAELVTGKDLDATRLGALKRFERRETLVLINVDLFGEGTDVPGVEVVQMCRPTASFPLFCQQVGRMLRLDISAMLMQMWDSLTPAVRLQQIAMSRKPKALLIDHVGNIHREFKIGDLVYSGPPEGFNAWTLDRRGCKSGGGGAIPSRTCTECYQPYERFYTSCPFCGACAPEPMQRGGPEQVDGDLRFYDPDKLALIRAEVARIDGAAPELFGVTPIVARAAAGNWHARQVAQDSLRIAIANWAGRYNNVSDDVNYKRFFMTFGIDVPTAATLGASDADALRLKIDGELLR